MAYTLSNKCAKNLCKRTVQLQLIIKNVVTFFFGTQCLLATQYRPIIIRIITKAWVIVTAPQKVAGALYNVGITVFRRARKDVT